MLTHYTSLGSPASWKRVQFLRPSILSGAQPILTVEPRYDYDLSEQIKSPPYTKLDIAYWDEGLWDISKWTGSAQSYFETFGGFGMGRHVALAMKGETSTSMTYVGCDIMVDGGGLL